MGSGLDGRIHGDSGLGIEEHVRRFEADHDDYNAILLKALADRLAEAFAEHLHERIRTEFWGYAPEESLSNEALIQEQYQGGSPRAWVSGVSGSTEKRTIFSVLSSFNWCDADRTWP